LVGEQVPNTAIPEPGVSRVANPQSFSRGTCRGTAGAFEDAVIQQDIPVYDKLGLVVLKINQYGELINPKTGKRKRCPVEEYNGRWIGYPFSTFISQGVRHGFDGSVIVNYRNENGGDQLRCHVEQYGKVWWDVVEEW
jgi:hypothetical protein